MSSVTIKNIPDELMARLRQQAAEDRRSLNKEVIHLVEAALRGEHASAGDRAQSQIRAQTQAWSALAGQWQSDVDTAEETKAIYAARSNGRPVDL
jgi:plasmid stability protein